MRALVVDGPGRSAVTDVPEPVPGPGEVLVSVEAAGICGSDLELLDGRRPAAYTRYPVVPGHEWAGRVQAAGPGVRDLAPGDPVVAEGLRSCGVCERCTEGRTNLCVAGYAETGFTHPGALAERLVVPARLVHRLPAGRPVEPAALLEPAARVASGLLEAGTPPPGPPPPWPCSAGVGRRCCSASPGPGRRPSTRTWSPSASSASRAASPPPAPPGAGWWACTPAGGWTPPR